ncbi:hypothetical protein [Treponema socranskii]|uniref:hypothetical protein n=1 Tax=Treponema socranskii TaxID=53419 RepID=UPI0028EEA088|nr:hypothetical protein [Treponema socranskii]
MKRVGIVFAIFFIAVQIICADEAKYYSDCVTGYKGYAEAEYIGKGDSERYLEELEKAKEELQKVYLDGKYDVSDILKLTKEDLWLCRSALSEYDLEDREIYLVYWYRTPDQDTVKFLIAVIKDNGNSFDYYFAKAVTEKE